MQKLSRRLQAAADFVTCGNRAADVGTDHGYLPIYLVQSGRCPGAVAMDINEGPLKRAAEHIGAAGLRPYIQTRLSDGLQNLRPGEADSVVIAGMGGLTVIKILEAAADMLPHMRELILGPQSETAKVRKFLREHRMYIDRENLVFEDGKYYPILHAADKRACAGEGHGEGHEGEACAQDGGYMHMLEYLHEQLPQPGRLQRVLDQYGGQLACDRHPVLQRLLKRDEGLKRGILASLENSAPQERHALRRQELAEQLYEIQVLRKWMQMDVKEIGE